MRQWVTLVMPSVSGVCVGEWMIGEIFLVSLSLVILVLDSVVNLKQIKAK